MNLKRDSTFHSHLYIWIKIILIMTIYALPPAKFLPLSSLATPKLFWDFFKPPAWPISKKSYLSAKVELKNALQWYMICPCSENVNVRQIWVHELWQFVLDYVSILSYALLYQGVKDAFKQYMTCLYSRSFFQIRAYFM